LKLWWKFLYVKYVNCVETGLKSVMVLHIELFLLLQTALSDEESRRVITQTLESAKECIQINYYGAKRTFEYLLPLLQLSDSPRVVNVSSLAGTMEVSKYVDQ